MSSIIPFVIEKTSEGERSYDIYSRLLEDRIIFIGDEIDTELSNSVIAQLLLLDQQDSSRDIHVYINSFGGCISSGLAIYDTMNYVKSDIRTVCVGIAASMAAVLLAGGSNGKRIALPNAQIMIHQPRSSMYEQTATDLEIDVKQIKFLKLKLAEILALKTGNNKNKILKDIERDTWMTPLDAKNYGIIDEVVGV